MLTRQEKKKLNDAWASVKDAIFNVDLSQRDDRVEFLTVLQSSVVTVGEFIEEKFGEEAYNLIDDMELFCEELYECAFDNSYDVNILKEHCTALEEKFTSLPAGRVVLFLPYKYEMWDSLQTVWEAFSKDPDWTTYVMPIPYFTFDNETEKLVGNLELELFLKNGISCLDCNSTPLEAVDADLIFIHNPYDNGNYVSSVHPNFYSEELKKLRAKVIYIPYYTKMAGFSQNHQQISSYNNVDYIVLPSEKAKESFQPYPYYNKTVVLGSPKNDLVVRAVKESQPGNEGASSDAASEESDKIRIVLNTTLEILHQDETYLPKLRNFLERFCRYENLHLIWRPHPLILESLRAMRPNLVDTYEEILEWYQKEKVGELDIQSSAARTVANSDLYLGDPYSSFCFYYMVAGKPAYLWKASCTNDDEGAENVNTKDLSYWVDGFKNKNRYEFFGCRESEEYPLYAFLDFLNGKDGGELLAQVSVREKEAMKDINANMDGTAGYHIYEYFSKM